MPRHNLTNLRLTADLAFWPSAAAADASGQSFEAVAVGDLEDAWRMTSTLSVIEAARHLHLFPARPARRLAKCLAPGSARHRPGASLAAGRAFGWP